MMAAALLELTTELPDFNDGSSVWASRIISTALKARRPAWAAAARAVNALGLLTIGERTRALHEIATAESELQAEHALSQPRDPMGKLHGTATAHGHLGSAWQHLRCYEEAAHHFACAAATSDARYGAVLSHQVLWDSYRRCVLHYSWALDLEALGDERNSVAVATVGRSQLDDLSERLDSESIHYWGLGLEVTGIGLTSILTPYLISDHHLHLLTSLQSGDVYQPPFLTGTLLVTQARVARILGDRDVAIGAAETVEWLLGNTDAFYVDAAWREALITDPTRGQYDLDGWRDQRDRERLQVYALLSALDCSPFPTSARSPGSSLGSP